MEDQMAPSDEGYRGALDAGERPEIDPARKAFVKQWQDRVRHAKNFHKQAFQRIEWCRKFARNGADAEWIKAENYVVAAVQRHINQAVAQIYAKNPTAIAKPREKLLTPNWDGKTDTLRAALQMAQAGDPMAAGLLMEVDQASQYLRMQQQQAKTMELLFRYFISEQRMSYKRRLKAAVRRAKVCGVAYVKLGYQRITRVDPEVNAQIADMRMQIASVERLMKEGAELSDDSPQLEDLRSQLAALQQKPEIILREGPVLDFPRAEEIIIDPKCRHLASLEGAGWIAHEFDFTPEEIEEIYGVDVGEEYTRHVDLTASRRQFDKSRGDGKTACLKVWEIAQIGTGLEFTIADGYPDYIREPAEPDAKLERFWRIFPLTFNDVESDASDDVDDSIYPPSDVWLLRHPQKEYNRSREELRLHRKGNRPGYAVPKGALEDSDKSKLAERETNAIIELNGLVEGDDIRAKLQALPNHGIDPNLYDVGPQMDDILRTVGSQEANLGTTSDSTATESSIAENSRQTSLSDNVDELDDVLTDLARAMGEVMLLNLAKETVVEIVGPGAVWPESIPTREEVAKDLQLEIKAGSSGRPNQAAELAKFERAAPWVVQMPGVNPAPLAEKVLDLLDINAENRIIEGLPSITALNSAANKPPPQEPGKNPEDQGGKGAQNAQNPQTNEPQAQPAFPTQGGMVQ